MMADVIRDLGKIYYCSQIYTLQKFLKRHFRTAQVMVSGDKSPSAGSRGRTTVGGLAEIHCRFL